MKKNYIQCVLKGTMALTLGATLLLVGCKGNKKESTEETTTETTKTKSFDGLDGAFAKAVGETEDEMEFLDFETVTDDEGDEIDVAYFRYNGEIFQMMDLDGDGLFEVAVVDANEDGDISDDEIVDITDQNITIDDIAEMANEQGYTSGDDDEDGGYDTDDSGSSYDEGTSSTRSRVPATQRQEESDEADLPDYVNNARVKAMRHK